jgi:hypothetical protein
VEYYNGSGWTQFQATAWNTEVTCLEVSWSGSGNPQVVVGLGNGSIQAYNGSVWTQLQGTGWGSAIASLSAQSSQVTLSGYSAA